MKTYRMINAYEDRGEYKTEIFSKENAKELLDHMNKKLNLKKTYKIIIEDKPLHQKIVSIHAQFDDEYNDVFISQSVLLPAIGSSLPEEIEVNDDIIWNITNYPANYFELLIGREYTETLETNLIYSNGFSAEDVLRERLRIRFGYNRDQIDEICLF